jgi:CPA2 family monovalent cation:H+ antiporter-2
MRTLVFGLGLTQVVLTVLGAVLGNQLLTTASAWFGVPWDLGWQGAFVLGAPWPCPPPPSWSS